MLTFTEFYLRKISEALIDRAVERGKWMTQAEVERMHLTEYRSGYFTVRRQDGRWLISWDNRATGESRIYVAHRGGKAVSLFEKVRREVDLKLDSVA